MSSSFLVMECYNCKSIETTCWSFFETTLKLFCDYCVKCSNRIQISRDQESLQIPPAEVVFQASDIPNFVLTHPPFGVKNYITYSYIGQFDFTVLPVEETKLCYPVLILQPWEMAAAIVFLEDLEGYLNEPPYW